MPFYLCPVFNALKAEGMTAIVDFALPHYFFITNATSFKRLF
jgi:hypothetical protein